ETTFATDDGEVVMIDFMPPRGLASDVVRLVRGVRGNVKMRMELIVRFGYGANVPWVRKLGDGVWHAIAGPDMVVLRTQVPLVGKDLATVAEFDVSAGDEIPLVLTYELSHLPLPKAIDPLRALADTQEFWDAWSARCNYHGEARELVLRSLITLKALIYAPT